MSQRIQTYILAGLVVLLAVIVYYYFFDKTEGPGFPGVLAADVKFQPLDVQEAQLRLDKLEKLRQLEYSGSHRNIFVAAPPPLPQAQGRAAANAAPRFVGPMPPPPPPPLQI